MSEIEKRLSFKRLDKGFSIEMPIRNKSGNLVKIGYYKPGEVGKEDSIDIMLNTGTYINPAWSFPFPNAKKVKITLELVE